MRPGAPRRILTFQDYASVPLGSAFIYSARAMYQKTDNSTGLLPLNWDSAQLLSPRPPGAAAPSDLDAGVLVDFVFTPDKSERTAEDILSLRLALRLATKLKNPRKTTTEWSRAMTNGAQVALLLAATGASQDQVMAGFLFDSLACHCDQNKADREAVIRRKFGADVLRFVQRVSDFIDPVHGKIKNFNHGSMPPKALAVCCAAQCVFATQLEKQHFDKLLRIYKRAGVAPALIENFQSNCDFQRSLDLEVEWLKSAHSLTAHYTGPQIRRIMESLEKSVDYFQDSLRRWGPKEELPLSAHAIEVGFILAVRGAPQHVVVAGLIHDVYEDYSSFDVNVIEQHIVKLLGADGFARVAGMAAMISEPPKESVPDNFWHRKQSVLDAVESADTDVINLLLATKISTLSAGNKFLRAGASVNDWSAGGYADNFRLFSKYIEIGKQSKADPVLLEMLQHELTLFESLQASAERL